MEIAGQSLARWMSSFHRWANDPRLSSLRRFVSPERRETLASMRLRHMADQFKKIIRKFPEVFQNVTKYDDVVDKVTAAIPNSGEVIHGKFSAYK